METIITMQAIVILFISGFAFWVKRFINDTDMRFKQHDIDIKELKENSNEKYEKLTAKINETEKNILEKIALVQLESVKDIAKLLKGMKNDNDN